MQNFFGRPSKPPGPRVKRGLSGTVADSVTKEECRRAPPAAESVTVPDSPLFDTLHVPTVSVTLECSVNQLSLLPVSTEFEGASRGLDLLEGAFVIVK